MVNKNRMNRAAAAMAATALMSVAVPGATAQAATATPRIDLKVLVVDDGGSSVGAITAQLKDTGVPYTRVDLTGAGRPVIDAAFLADTVDGRPRAKYQGVVLPNENPFGEGSAEMAALTAYETTYGIRQVDAYTWAHPGVGLEYTDNGGYSGQLDGTQAAVTAAGKAGPFGYLGGQVTFEDNSAMVPESYGFMGKPRTGYTSYLDAPVTGGRASLVGEYTHDGRSELVVTFGYNQYQQQFRLLARGIVDWLTQGVHLGQERSYFAVHVDDVFAPDARWSKELNCTPGDYACAGGEGKESTIRMTAADAQYAAQWQTSKNFKLDMLFNAGAGEEWKAENGGTDAMTAQLVADRAKFRWMNHTYTHPFLGCVQDTSANPWTCTKNAQGATNWMSRADISAQIRDNNNWAASKGITLDRSELVTGEHSGLKTLPQQPQDNPNLAGALADNGVKWAGSDNSREPDQRAVGAALTVPRHPMNVYYNTGTNAEMADEYNWIYTSRADGGSGICEDNPATSTCLPAPLDTNTGYLDHIVPAEARTAMRHVLANDPRPHYVHQSNLAEDRTLYPVLNQVLDTYRALYAPSAPIVNQSMKDTGVELQRRAAWNKAVADGKVTAYRIGKDVVVKAPSGVVAPVTAPNGTKKQLLLGTADFGTAYAGTRSAWTAPEALQSQVTLKLL
ncbi:hypothetical protein [Streptomyces lavendulae]|uniref:hypothetical protein n=1 Tax=Streptomyces lavendulae TaxID=1914 RepID=UPI0024A06E67|nr:hypothetical protein [Streptomyces lavendulae]GLX23907.1 hypothetical protein Slala01_75510 [Streptomyces lavendulae subsp. lavendulae]GLX31675.1 hypothetical protein Slala02_74940 [Streptomyces lavendulae subsp. lavendulae]